MTGFKERIQAVSKSRERTQHGSIHSGTQLVDRRDLTVTLSKPGNSEETTSCHLALHIVPATFSRLRFHHILRPSHLNHPGFAVRTFFLPLYKYFSKPGIQRRGHHCFCMGICLLSFYGHFYIQKVSGLVHHETF